MNTAWQYNIRQELLDEDVNRVEKALGDVSRMRAANFDLAAEDKSVVFDEVREFIKRYEWLGRMSLYPTHIFTARLHGELAGAVVMDMPNAFSKMLGDDTRKVERLISRGACASWTPKNLASSMIMFSVRWMSKHTPFRLFTAYADPEANELGTIYQACNFYYLGQSYGTSKQFLVGDNRWVSDRYFRSRSVYKRLAIEAGIPWDSGWQLGDRVLFEKMPQGVAEKIKQLSKDYMQSSPSRDMPKKHKYAYVLGETKAETIALRKLFLERNKNYPYPTERGKG